MPLVASQVVGLILLRYVARGRADRLDAGRHVVATYAPTLQRYLTGALPCTWRRMHGYGQSGAQRIDYGPSRALGPRFQPDGA